MLLDELVARLTQLPEKSRTEAIDLAVKSTATMAGVPNPGPQIESAGTPSGHDDFYKSYVLFVDLVQKKIMGGARFTASKAR
jgi:hypothetical protein